MTQNDIVRQKLEQRRDKLQQKIAEIDNAERVETAQGQTDNAHEWENADIRADLAAEAERQLEAVQAALVRLAEGSYGVCESCGKPIGAKRLEVLSDAVRCVACAEVEE